MTVIWYAGHTDGSDNARPQLDKGRRFWLGLPRERKLILALLGLLVLVAVIVVVVVIGTAFSGSSGSSRAYQGGYSDGVKQANSAAASDTDPNFYCGAIASRKENDNATSSDGCPDRLRAAVPASAGLAVCHPRRLRHQGVYRLRPQFGSKR
jgi:hypothetical protein